MKNAKINITSTFISDPLLPYLEFFLNKFIAVDIEMAQYNRVFEQLLNEDSLFYGNNGIIANIALIKPDDLYANYLEKVDIHDYCRMVLSNVSDLIQAIESCAIKTNLPLICCLCPIDTQDNIHLKNLEKQIYDNLHINLIRHQNIVLINWVEIEKYYPVSNIFNAVTNKVGHIPYEMSYYAALGTMIARKIYSLISKQKKVIVLDCDNTLWRGIVGEVTVENITVSESQRALQQFMKKQLEMGRLLCLCSKNIESDVMNVFTSHQNMILKKIDLAAWRVNWQSKTENLLALAKELNLALDSFIFIDDDPVEREEVSNNLPQVLTLEMPKLEEKIIHYLQHVWSFDNNIKSEEDSVRTIYYQEEKKRKILKKSTLSFEEYIAKLDLTVLSSDVQADDISRIIQLSKRTSQFNFTNRQLARDALCSMRQKIKIKKITVSDKYGDYGIVGYVYFSIQADSLLISNIVLSCRVLGRGVEVKLMKQIMILAEKHQKQKIKFIFKPSIRNFPAFNFVNALPVAQIERHWEYQIFTVQLQDCYDNNKSLIKNFTTVMGSENEVSSKLISDHQKILQIAANFHTVDAIIDSFCQHNQQLHPQRINAAYLPSSELEQELASLFSQVLNQHVKNIHDNFFRLGGNSLLATIFISKLADKYKIDPPLDFIFNMPTISMLSKFLSHHDFNKTYEVDSLIDAKNINEEIELPLSWAQKRLYFIQECTLNSSVYNMFIAYSLKGSLNVLALEKSFNYLLNKHDCFRTSFTKKEGVPYQKITSKLEGYFPLNIEQIKDLNKRAVDQLVYQFAKQPFELAKAPLFRVRLLQRDNDFYYLLINMHHIISDGWSYNIFIQQLSEQYKKYCEGEMFTDVVPQYNYANFTNWHNQYLDKIEAAQLEFWLKKLSDHQPASFPLKNRQLPKKENSGSRSNFKIDGSLSKKLKSLSNKYDVSLFTMLQTAFSILLSKYTNQQDVVFATPVSNRHYPYVSEAMGFFVNIILLRSIIDNKISFSALLEKNHQMIKGAIANQDLPYNKLVSAIHPCRDNQTSPLSQVVFVFQNYKSHILSLQGTDVERIYADNDSLLLADYDSAKMEFTFYLQEIASGEIEGLVEYKNELYHADYVAAIIENYKNILAYVVDAPDTPALKIPMLSKFTISQLLLNGNVNQFLAYRHDATIIDLLFDKVKLYPDKVAVRQENYTLTYQELWDHIESFSIYLRNQGLYEKQYVTVCLSRSVWLVISLFAIVKSGGVYVPICPRNPYSRVNYIINDCQSSMLITSEKFHASLAELQYDNSDISIIVADRLQNCLSHVDKKTDGYTAKNSSAACAMFYTSGSTGRPKAVEIGHRSLMNLVASQQSIINIDHHDNVLQFASSGFDASIWEIMGALLTGATLYIPDDEVIFDQNALVDYIKNHHITNITLTPSYLGSINSQVDLPSVKTLVVAGEQCPLPLATNWSKKIPNMFNAYGPTEATICVTIGKVNALDLVSEGITIGRPINNARIYILDGNLALAPVGAIGEIHIAGDCLALGYLHHDASSKQKFLENTHYEPNGRLYKTGDYAMWLPSGKIVYIGRRDNQTKIRGFRVEIDEIQNCLLSHPFVKSAAVCKGYSGFSQEQLIGYYIPKFDKKNKTTLAEKLKNDYVTNWSDFYHYLYTNNSNNITFDTIGWLNSYTNTRYTKEEIDDWLMNTVERILQFNPKNVLEVGCGTGLLLQKIAKKCQRYHATDFSEKIISILEGSLKNNIEYANVTFDVKEANAIDDTVPACYDTVILNSVVQYFPDIDYLVDVIDSLLEHTIDGGYIFIGDVRSLTHLRMFHANIQWKNSNTIQKCDEWKSKLEFAILNEKELVISHEFFNYYAACNSRVKNVYIQVKPSHHENEMTSYRYDVVLAVGEKSAITDQKKLSVNWQNWGGQYDSLESIVDVLAKNTHQCLGIKNIPNQRFQLPGLVLNCKLDCTSFFLETVNRHIQLHEQALIPPDAFYKLCDNSHYRLYLTWSSDDPVHCLDAIFIHHDFNFTDVQINDLSTYGTCTSYQQYANEPLFFKLSEYATEKISGYLKTKLPSYMVPSTLIPVEKLPLTFNGKLDLSLLEMNQSYKNSKNFTYNEHEYRLQTIFATSLELPINHIDVEKSFFDLGGNSLLVVKIATDIANKFNIEIEVSDLYTHPAIRQLAKLIAERTKAQHQHEVTKAINFGEKLESLLIKKGSSKNTLYFFPAMGNNSQCYNSLISLIEPQWSCHTFRDYADLNKSFYYQTFDEISQAYTDHLLNISTGAAYNFCGYAFGGLIAADVADRLVRYGKNVNSVILLDTWYPINALIDIIDNDEFYGELWCKYNHNKATSLVDKAEWMDLCQQQVSLLRSYKLSRFNIPLYLLKAKNTLSYYNYTKNNQDYNYWPSEIHQYIQRYILKGDHYSMMHYTNINDVADKINKILMSQNQNIIHHGNLANLQMC